MDADSLRLLDEVQRLAEVQDGSRSDISRTPGSAGTEGGPLTDTMIAELAAHVGFENVGIVVANARGGDSRARRELLKLNVKASSREFMTSWHGAQEIGAVCKAFTAELNILQPPPPIAARNPQSKHCNTSADVARGSRFVPSAASMRPFSQRPS